MQNRPLTAQDSLDDWLNYVFGIHVSAIDLGLSRVLPVFEALNIGQPSAYVFTVAGTNGKGSTTATLAAICQQAGYKTALYQSPHLLVFNERVKINGQMVSDAALVAALYRVEQARLACGLTLSFFEMTTLAAMLIFAEAECDVWVLEIGLGGRLDVVNIIDPNLAVITNIGIDHIEWLGDTREQIGVEKAGILRDDITLVYGEADMPTTIPALVAKHHARVLQYGQDYDYSSEQGATSWQYSQAGVTLALPLPNLSQHNTATAITAALASDLTITRTHIAHALPQVQLAGRFDRRQLDGRQWVFDVAHNVHGMTFLLSQFVPYWQAYRTAHPNAQLYLIISMLVDKDIDSVLQHLQALPFVQVFSGVIANPRAADKQLLQNKLGHHFTVPATVFDDLAAATYATLANSRTDDLVLVCGSFHTIGDVLKTLAHV